MTTDNTGESRKRQAAFRHLHSKRKNRFPRIPGRPTDLYCRAHCRGSTTEVFYKSVTSQEKIIRGGVAVEKWDSEKDRREPQGAASLEGTQIQIISQNDLEILVDGKTYKKAK